MSAPSPESREQRLREALRRKAAARAPGRQDIGPRFPDTPALLDEQQRGIWLAHALDPDSAAYHLASAARVQGDLDSKAVEEAFRRLVGHHRLLRSSFPARDGVVEQRIHDEVPVRLERIEAPPGSARDVATKAARAPFDLEQPPLVRLLLVAEPESGERLLVLVLHHILSDERALAGLWRDLAAAMNGDIAGNGSAPQYDDWAAWRRQGAERGGPEDGLARWRQVLDPLPADLELPFPEPAHPAGGRGAMLSRPLDGDRSDALRALARRLGTTPFVVGAFAFRLLLQRLADDPDFAFATPVSTRTHPAMHGMLGAFINSVVIPEAVREDLSVEDAVRRYDGALRSLLSKADTPFHVIAEALGAERPSEPWSGRHPLFQAMFVHQEREPLPDLGDARLEAVTLDLGAPKFELTGFLLEAPDGFEVAVEYRRDRFEDGAMRAFLDAYAAILSALPDGIDRPVADLDLLNDATRAQVRSFGTGEALAPETELLPVRIHGWSRRTPDAVAARCGDETLSYGELARRAAALQTALENGGVVHGDRVGVFLPRGVDLVAGLVGIHRARAAYVPLDPGYPKARNQRVLEDAGVRVLLTTRDLAEAQPEGAHARLWLEDLDPDSESRDATGRDGREPEAPLAAADDIAYLLYTSGSTGRPKGVAVTQANLRASTAARLQVYGSEPPRYLLLPSIAFDSSVAGIFGALAAGGTVILPREDQRLDPAELGALMAAAEVSHLLCVPSLYAGLLERNPPALQRLAVAIVAGERCPASLVRAHFQNAPDVHLFNEYGPTEGTVWATVHAFTPADADGPIPIGRPIPGVTLEVLDRGGRALPPGIPGVGWITGPTVAKGYWNQPEITAERFLPVTGEEEHAGRTGQRRYRTGDLLSWTDDGRLLFHGREDQQLKLRGFRIEPAEIEAALADLDGVGRTAVVVRPLDPDRAGPPQLVAFVETEGAGVGADWRERLATQLPEHMVPARLEALDALPRLPNGKVDPGALQALPLDAGDAGREAPATRREAHLAALWAGLLGHRDFGRDDNFFTLGGHSLLAVQLALAIERDLGVALPPAEIFAHPTLRELATRIDRRAGKDGPVYDHLFPIQPGGEDTPFVVAIPHFFADLFADRFRGERPVVGLRGVGLRPEGNLGRWRTMTDLGEHLVEEITRRFPERPVILAGYSFGASMALEATRLMERRGLVVEKLVLIAPMARDLARVGPLRLQIDALRQPVDDLSTREALGRWWRANHPLSLSLYRRLWRRTVVEGWRRALCGMGRLRRARGLPLTEKLQWADVRVERFRLHAHWRPEPVRTPTLLFNAREPATDAGATWRPLFDGPLKVIDTPDPHLGDDAVTASRQVILDHLDDEVDA